MADVYLNSKFVGTTDNPSSFVTEVKDLRRKGSISEEVSVHHDNDANEVHLFSDEGRAQRPLIIVKEGKPLLTEKHIRQLEVGEITWHDMIRQGVSEYLDASEEETALVAYDEEELTP
ncbi:MAG: DNA-directed RNA polymerase subunit B, partial [Nanoarchaeota archaeon]